jgi:hypothetical protein
MKQATLGWSLSAKRTRKRELLEQMDRVVPWSALIGLIEPVYGRKSGVGRPTRAPSCAFAIYSKRTVWLPRSWPRSTTR